MPITLSIVEDDRGTRENLVALLRDEPKVRCLGAHATGEAALRAIPDEKPHVALIDINLPRMNGVECVARLTERMPALKVLMLTVYEDSNLIFQSLRAGASGYLLKKFLSAELIQAVEQVQAGGAPMSLSIARKVISHFHRVRPAASAVEKLTEREQEILTLLSRGYLNKEIGEYLAISSNTVRAHLRNIYDKLHVQSRTEAAAKLLRWDEGAPPASPRLPLGNSS